MEIHHYGLATKNLKRSAEVFSSLGYQVSEPIFDPIQQVEVSFVSREGQYPIELVCDSGTGGPTSGFLSKVGSGLYHICYKVDEMEETIGILRKKRFLVKQKPVKATAFKGKRIAWLYNRDIGLIELVER
jgi:methylmalonyl-CoA/ethylmalonyl-CoA epimerase